MNAEDDIVRTWISLLSTTNSIKKSVDTTLKDNFEVSLSRFDVLATLDLAGPEGLNVSNVSNRLMVTEGNTTQVVKPMIEGGLVNRQSSADDARLSILALTEAGQELFEATSHAHHQTLATSFSELSQKELSVLRDILAKLSRPTSTPSKESSQ